MCGFCRLDFEITEHLFNSCPKAQFVWRSISIAIGKQICFYDSFSEGSWISLANHDLELFTQSVIAVAVWLLWKARCNLVFKNEAPDFHSIPFRAVHHVREYSFSPSLLSGKKLIINNFSIFNNPFFFVSAVDSSESTNVGVGFYITDSVSKFIGAGWCNNSADSALEADALALITAMGSIYDYDIQIRNIFITNTDLHRAILSDNASISWRIEPLISNITDYLSYLGNPQIHIVPRSWMNVAVILAFSWS